MHKELGGIRSIFSIKGIIGWYSDDGIIRLFDPLSKAVI